MMEPRDSTRLALLQTDAKQGTENAAEKLTLADLLLLLREDDHLRSVIRDIVTTPVASAPSEGRDAHRALDRDHTGGDAADLPRLTSTAPTLPPTDALREQLGPELALLHMVRADADIAADWVNGQTSEGRQLLQLVACATQWDMLLELWDKLANRCKQGQRVASADELYILQTSLALHNLRWRGRQARLVDVAAGTAYDYERHQRGTTTGDRVRAQWLPGLVNAGGQCQKKPLVQT